MKLGCRQKIVKKLRGVGGWSGGGVVCVCGGVDGRCGCGFAVSSAFSYFFSQIPMMMTMKMKAATDERICAVCVFVCVVCVCVCVCVHFSDGSSTKIELPVDKCEMLSQIPVLSPPNVFNERRSEERHL